jgi:hypothetical protein
MTDAKQPAPEHNEACGQNWAKGECPGCAHQMREYAADPVFYACGAGFEYRATWEAAQWNIRERDLTYDGRVSLGTTRTREEAEARIKARIQAQLKYLKTGVWPIG